MPDTSEHTVDSIGVTYRTRSATEDEICSHLVSCNEDFITPLDQRVNIKEYASKLSRAAVTFEAWSGHILVGLVAAYFNDLKSRSGYITTVSIVNKFKGMGISSELLRACVSYAGAHNFREIRLEVHKDN